MSQNFGHSSISRRDFIRTSAQIAGVAAITKEIGAATVVRAASDQVTLGRTGVKLSRLGMGTGSINGQIQRDLGQEGFTRLLHYAYDHGITYIDTAENYKTHGMVREAIKGIPREKLYIQTKMPIRPEHVKDPLPVIDRYRQELGIDYLDSLLIHCATKATWVEDLKPVMAAFDEAQHRGWIRIKGCSCHGLGALRAATTNNWVQVHLARVNPQGHYVDGDLADVHYPEGKFNEAIKEIKAMHDKGRGVIGMKMVGNGDFKDAADRDKALRYAMTCGFVDAVVVGFKSPAEVDEAIGRVNLALK
jgi:predicted aldo/keto reductase-like oxidoreductase